jgi:hypothetical protein
LAGSGHCGRGLGLTLGLRGRRNRLLGLDEELIAEKGDEGDKGKEQCAAHIAAATAGTAALRLQIGILNFGQRILPVGFCSQNLEKEAVRPPLLLW